MVKILFLLLSFLVKPIMGFNVFQMTNFNKTQIKTTTMKSYSEIEYLIDQNGSTFWESYNTSETNIIFGYPGVIQTHEINIQFTGGCLPTEIEIYGAYNLSWTSVEEINDVPNDYWQTLVEEHQTHQHNQVFFIEEILLNYIYIRMYQDIQDEQHKNKVGCQPNEGYRCQHIHWYGHATDQVIRSFQPSKMVAYGQGPRDLVINYYFDGHGFDDMYYIGFSHDNCQSAGSSYSLYTNQNPETFNAEEQGFIVSHRVDASSYTDNFEVELCFSRDRDNWYSQNPKKFFRVFKVENIMPLVLLGTNPEMQLQPSWLNQFNLYLGFAINDNDCTFSQKIMMLTPDVLEFDTSYLTVGNYKVCLSTDNQIWGFQQKRVEFVNPEITSVSGCQDDNYQTINCPTQGLINITITGHNFLQVSNVNLEVKIDNQVMVCTRFSKQILSCILLPGSGIDRSVVVTIGSDSPEVRWLSYAPPVIYKVSGCQDQGNLTQGCSNQNNSQIKIIGKHFGPTGANLLVGQAICQNLIHDEFNPHQILRCQLPPARGMDKTVFAIQQNGQIGVGKNLVSFKSCNIGYFYKDSKCVPCLPGTYKSITGDTTCINCPDGTYSAASGSTSCSACPNNALSLLDRTGCGCRAGFYQKNMSDLINIECIQCPLPDNEGRVPFICDKIGVNLYNLQMSPGFWRWYNHSHNFYWCPVKETCPGGNASSCIDGHQHFVCQYCISSYSKNADGVCQPCQAYHPDTVLTITYIVVSLILLITSNLYIMIVKP